MMNIEDSVANRLIQAALKIAELESVGNAKDFLMHNAKRMNLKNWEMMAIGQEFMREVNESVRKYGKGVTKK